MNLDHLQRNWDDLGATDPLWAILAYPDRHGNKWTPEAFFATGEEWLGGYFDILDGLGMV